MQTSLRTTALAIGIGAMLAICLALAATAHANTMPPAQSSQRH